MLFKWIELDAIPLIVILLIEEGITISSSSLDRYVIYPSLLTKVFWFNLTGDRSIDSSKE